MASSKTRILRGVELLQCLASVRHTVNWYRLHDTEPAPIAPAVALAVAKSGNYEGKYKSPSPVLPYGRMVYIREYADPRVFVRDTHYLDDRAVIRFSVDQTSSPPPKQKARELADLWDRMLQQSPPPRSWVRV